MVGVELGYVCRHEHQPLYFVVGLLPTRKAKRNANPGEGKRAMGSITPPYKI